MLLLCTVPSVFQREAISRSHSPTLQIALHAIGDQAVEDVLAWYDTARTYTNAFSGRPASSPRRHRIEHAQHLLGPHTLAAMARQQIVAVVNPLHLLSDMLIMEERLGRDRIGPDRAFAYKAMLKVLPNTVSCHGISISWVLDLCNACSKVLQHRLLLSWPILHIMLGEMP